MMIRPTTPSDGRIARFDAVLDTNNPPQAAAGHKKAHFVRCAPDAIAGGRYWARTSDRTDVNRALRPTELIARAPLGSQYTRCGDARSTFGTVQIQRLTGTSYKN